MDDRHKSRTTSTPNCRSSVVAADGRKHRARGRTGGRSTLRDPTSICLIASLEIDLPQQSNQLGT
jgi:hypothetical protein